jgi:hypothetical protein
MYDRIKFRVLSVDEASRSAVVHYFTDQVTDLPPLNVTFYPDPIPTGQALVDYIMRYAPIEWLRLRSKLTAEGPAVMTEVRALIDTTQDVSIPELETRTRTS